MEYIVRKLLGLRYHQTYWIWFILFGRLHSTTELVPRLWEDEGGRRWAKSAKDLDLEMLCVSQFTLYHVMKVLISFSNFPPYWLEICVNRATSLTSTWPWGERRASCCTTNYCPPWRKATKKIKSRMGSLGLWCRWLCLSRTLFGVKFQVELINDGPVTLELEAVPPSQKPDTKEKPPAAAAPESA